MKNEEIDLLNLQMMATILFIASLVVSIILTYNEKLNLSNEKVLFGSKDEYEIDVTNRIFALIIALIFLYLNYKDYELKKNGENKNESLQVVASIFIVLAAIITLYTTIEDKGGKFQLSEIQNPII